MQMTLLYDYALQFVGVPYRWGGDDPLDGEDCSGYVEELLKAAGVIPAGAEKFRAADLYKKFPGVQFPVFGALAAFGAGEVTHIAFCMDSTHMLEAAGGGSATKTRADAAAQNAFVKLRPISHRSDLIGFCQPAYKWR